MHFSGNQGTVEIRGSEAIKRYHRTSDISSLPFFRREVRNLTKIRQLQGSVLGFQLPILHSYDEQNLTIVMSAVNLSKPYIVDFSTMHDDLIAFDGFMSIYFRQYVSAKHGIPKFHPGIDRLGRALTLFARQFSISYTDPKPTNVRVLYLLPDALSD
jgi:hypothetical protein